MDAIKTIVMVSYMTNLRAIKTYFFRVFLKVQFGPLFLIVMHDIVAGVPCDIASFADDTRVQCGVNAVSYCDILQMICGWYVSGNNIYISLRTVNKCQRLMSEDEDMKYIYLLRSKNCFKLFIRYSLLRYSLLCILA